MGRTVAILWHASFSIAAGVLYFFFVLPRWWELMGETPHTVGTVLRIVAGVLIALAALPVVFTLLRTRKPEYGTPQLALTLRTWSIVAHVLAGVLIVGTAISEIWLSLDVAGQWLFGVYGAAAAIAVLGFFGFYLSFVAELPPPPPKPLKPKKEQRRLPRKIRRKKGEEAEAAEAVGVPPADGGETEAGEAEETETVGVPPAGGGVAETGVADEAETSEEPTVEADVSTAVEPDVSTAVEPESTADEPEPAAVGEPPACGGDTVAVQASRGGLRNRRPTGKSSTSRRRRRSRGGVAVEDQRSPGASN